MFRETEATIQARKATAPRVQTVGFCHIDPDRIIGPSKGMPLVTGAKFLLTLDCPDAIEAALRGELDVLVVDGSRVTVSGLTALSFLRRERPEVKVYIFTEGNGAPPTLERWDSVN